MGFRADKSNGTVTFKDVEIGQLDIEIDEDDLHEWAKENGDYLPLEDQDAVAEFLVERLGGADGTDRFLDTESDEAVTKWLNSNDAAGGALEKWLAARRWPSALGSLEAAVAAAQVEFMNSGGVANRIKFHEAVTALASAVKP